MICPCQIAYDNQKYTIHKFTWDHEESWPTPMATLYQIYQNHQNSDVE